MSDPMADGEQPRWRPRRGPAARHDDPGAMARADVRAILGTALGLRRIVELAAEVVAGQSTTTHPDPARASPRRPRAV